MSSLVDEAGTPLAEVSEFLEPISVEGLAGFRRRVLVNPAADAPSELRMRIPTPSSASSIATFGSAADSGDQRQWRVFLRENGVYECIRSCGDTASVVSDSPEGHAELFEQTGLTPGSLGFFAVEHVFSTTWSERVRDQLRALP